MDDSEAAFDLERQILAEAQSPTINQALRRELLAMMARDQACRKDIAARYAPGQPLSPADAHWALGVDDANTDRMQAILAQYGWPPRSLVGRDGSEAAWLLVQHADRQPEFQRHALTLLSRAVSAGQADGQAFAYLLDRVRLHAGQPQIFGTQLNAEGGPVRPFDLIDPENVDYRRALVGLPPLADYIAHVQAHVSGLAQPPDPMAERDP